VSWFAAQTGACGIFPVFGLEVITLIDRLVREGIKINDPGNPGKMYVCGLGITGFNPMSAEARGLLDIIRNNDRRRMGEMVTRMADVFDARGVSTGLNEDRVVDMVADRHGCPRHTVYLQERHVAKAFQEAFFQHVPPSRRAGCLREVLDTSDDPAADDPVKIQGLLRTHLMKVGKPAYVEESFVNFEQGFRLILELGGIPCYPILADGASPICDYERDIDKLIDDLKARNFHCVELIPIRNQPSVLEDYAKAMRQGGFVVASGTEHNTLDLLPIEPTCINGQVIEDDIKDIFWEAACVAAAHQFLMLHGQCGFVDRQGNAHPDYDSDEQRIDAFKRLGAAVIQRYYQITGCGT